MVNHIVERVIDIVKEDSNKALGCTEPVALAYCANVAASYIDKSNIQNIYVELSKNIYKNAKSVKIPNTNSYGIDIAVGVGALAEKVDSALMIFSNIDSEIVENAKQLIKEEKIIIKYLKNSPDIYVKVRIETKDKKVEVTLSDSHTNIEKICLNEETIFEEKYEESKDQNNNESKFDIKKLSFRELRKIIEETDAEEFYFTLEGIKVNMNAAEEGLKRMGSNLGKALHELKKEGILADNFISDVRIMTAAAADMRMGGGNCPIMTSGGSGNQGIGVIIPIAIVAEKENVDKDRLSRALFFAHAINRYVKEYSGKLSGICGCAIGAAIGATAGMTWMIGGDDTQIAGACSNIYANLTGLVCDGAKESCSMKLSTTAEESIISTYLAVNGVISEKNVGILGNNIEGTISNVGKLSRDAFTKVDDLILEIIN